MLCAELTKNSINHKLELAILTRKYKGLIFCGSFMFEIEV